MERYSNRSGNSPVSHYQINESSITVWFNGSTRAYTYSYSRAGRANVETMKGLARSGAGLSAYITRNVRNLYD